MPSNDLEKHLKIALDDVGPISPWFDKDVNAWVFEHDAYPVRYAGDSKEEVIQNYPLYLKDFLEERLKDNLAPSVERVTSGRGGKRPGAGRPKGTTKSPTKVIRLPLKVVQWINSDPTSLNKIQSLMKEG